MNIYQKLQTIQTNLKAEKNFYNNFGKYKYRSAESILEALKPLLTENKVTIYFHSTLKADGAYLFRTGTLTFRNTEKDEVICLDTMIREDVNKKGMSADQMGGSNISYLKKYMLGDLFLLDDTADSDAMQPQQQQQIPLLNQIEQLAKIKNVDIAQIESAYKKSLSTFTQVELNTALKTLQSK